MIQVLMIEDDAEFASLLQNFLLPYNIELTNYEDPFLGLSAGVEKYDLLILDLTLPGIDGLEVCKEIVQKYDIPIIISSARSDVSDRVVGLRIGADDYLPKPYDPQEMVARIMSLLRRYKKVNDTSTSVEPTKRIYQERETIVLDNVPLELTPAEFEVLKLLTEQIGFTVSKEQILYHSDIFAQSSDASLAVIMNRLRKKLGNKAEIKTVRGVGYKLLI
jgi:two-component system OmpR family response regulator